MNYILTFWSLSGIYTVTSIQKAFSCFTLLNQLDPQQVSQIHKINTLTSKNRLLEIENESGHALHRLQHRNHNRLIALLRRCWGDIKEFERFRVFQNTYKRTHNITCKLLGCASDKSAFWQAKGCRTAFRRVHSIAH